MSSFGNLKHVGVGVECLLLKSLINFNNLIILKLIMESYCILTFYCHSIIEIFFYFVFIFKTFFSLFLQIFVSISLFLTQILSGSPACTIITS